MEYDGTEIKSTLIMYLHIKYNVMLNVINDNHNEDQE